MGNGGYRSVVLVVMVDTGDGVVDTGGGGC